MAKEDREDLAIFLNSNSYCIQVFGHAGDFPGSSVQDVLVHMPDRAVYILSANLEVDSDIQNITDVSTLVYSNGTGEYCHIKF